MPLLITDLDNTLYDWVTFYAQSFRALADALVNDLGVDREKLLDEFKAVHQAHGDSEYPFAALELPSVRAKYGDKSAEDLKRAIDHAFYAFNRVRKTQLKLYDGVEASLNGLQNAGVTVIGHTEAMAVNALFRLKHLGVVRHFRRLYALEGKNYEPGGEELSRDFIRVVPRQDRKPNPCLVRDICSREGASIEDTWYIGDSLTRDISMAKAAGVKAVWAKYGTVYDRELWDSLVRITHWTDEDVAREAALRKANEGVQPDFTIDSFAEITRLMGIG